MSLSIYYPTGCEEVEVPHFCDDCELSEGARVRSAFFIQEGTEFDYTSAAAWIAAIAAGTVIIIAKTNGSFDGGTPNYSGGFGDELQTYINSEYKATFRERNLVENWDFYEAKKRSTKWKFGFRTASLVWITDVIASIAPKVPVADDAKALVYWEIDVTWISAHMPRPYAMPADVFICFETN